MSNVKRFSQHRKNYDNIINYWFQEINKQKLDEIEQKLIQEAEIRGLLLTNKTYVSNVIGDTDLDIIISPEDQKTWLEENKELLKDTFDLFALVDENTKSNTNKIFKNFNS